MSDWTVVWDVRARARVVGWRRSDQLDVAAIVQLLQEEGPGAFDHEVEGGLDVLSWDAIETPIQVTLWAVAAGPFYVLDLEARPERLLIVRSIKQGAL